MKIADVISGLCEVLDDRLEQLGFRFRRGDTSYVRKEGDIRFIFGLGVDAMTGWFRIAPEAFVSSVSINKTFQTILCTNIPFGGITCGFGIGNECDHKRGRYQVETPSDIPPVAASIFRDCTDVAKPFFERVNSLEGIDRYMNTIPEGRGPAGSVWTACKALIAAKMAGNPRFKELSEYYYNFWVQAQSPSIAEDIRTVTEALKPHSGQPVRQLPCGDGCK